ncbi:MAG: hypothetical protein GY820_37045 [Gammaproteobacteria bacterium]|nr:hypothetical protein [Gammaproteobacteria bacterium]
MHRIASSGKSASDRVPRHSLAARHTQIAAHPSSAADAPTRSFSGTVGPQIIADSRSE